MIKQRTSRQNSCSFFLALSLVDPLESTEEPRSLSGSDDVWVGCVGGGIVLAFCRPTSACSWLAQDEVLRRSSSAAFRGVAVLNHDTLSSKTLTPLAASMAKSTCNSLRCGTALVLRSAKLSSDSPSPGGVFVLWMATLPLWYLSCKGGVDGVVGSSSSSKRTLVEVLQTKNDTFLPPRCVSEKIVRRFLPGLAGPFQVSPEITPRSERSQHARTVEISSSPPRGDLGQ